MKHIKPIMRLLIAHQVSGSRCKWCLATLVALVLGCLTHDASVALAQQSDTNEAVLVSNSLVAATSQPLAGSLPTQAASPAPTESASNRGFYLDVSAILFGWLAVIFALVTVGSFVWGITKFHDLIARVESDIRTKVNSEFTSRLAEVFDQEIRPKVQKINEEELERALEKARTLIASEMQKTIDSSDLKGALIDNVSGEIMKRLSTPPVPTVKPDEFE